MKDLIHCNRMGRLIKLARNVKLRYPKHIAMTAPFLSQINRPWIFLKYVRYYRFLFFALKYTDINNRELSCFFLLSTSAPNSCNWVKALSLKITFKILTGASSIHEGMRTSLAGVALVLGISSSSPSGASLSPILASDRL